MARHRPTHPNLSQKRSETERTCDTFAGGWG